MANLTTVDADESVQPLQVVDPYMLFSRLRGVWSATSYPNLVDYTIVETASVGNVHQTLSYTGQLEYATGDFRVHSISLEEAAHPYVPKGTNITYSLYIGIRTGASGVSSDSNANGGIRLSGMINPEKPLELFAVPEISPVYSFGIRSCSFGREIDDTQPSDLSIIGRVSAASRRYRISVEGVESIAGQRTIHLALVALKDRTAIVSATYGLNQPQIH